MKIVTNASYYGTGSSVITDLLGEYKGIKSLSSEFECRIAYDMFGLSDLEYFISENNHRHNSSVAINMFRRLCGIYGLNKYTRLENYPAYLGENFSQKVDDYLNKIIIDSFSGGAHTDIYMKSDLEIFCIKVKDYLYNKFHKYKISVDDASWAAKGITPYEKEVKKCIYNITFPKDHFLQYTKEFTRSLFSQYDDGETSYLMVDQLVPPSNTMRYTRYFDDIKVFCVDRDPRDIYYNEKKFWHGGVAPTDSEKFVKWFKATRAHRTFEKDDTNVVMRLQFEDLIFNYENSLAKIEAFLGIESCNHVEPFTRFNPDKSKNNVGRWKNDSSIVDEIVILEKELQDYLSYE